MSTLLNSDTQYIDESTGELINNGYIYIGLNGLDAKINPATIYSDRELTTVLANPQRTGADGRSVNKIWVDGKYSMKIESSANVQKLNELTLGESQQTNTTSLTNVQGTDSLTADANITELVNNQIYILTAVANNTGSMTLTIDLTPTWPIKKQHDNDMQANDIESGQTLAVVFNEADSVFELMTNSAIGPVNLANAQTIAGAKTFSNTLVTTKGADIASANDTVLLSDGNYNDITGTTQINGFTDGLLNEVRKFHFDGEVLLKHATAPSAGYSQLWLSHESDFVTTANDEIEFIYDGVYWRSTTLPERKEIKSITATVNASALTLGVKADTLDFRSATLTDGIPATVSFADLSIVVPSTATLGTVDGVESRLIPVVINNAGTAELAVINKTHETDLSETGVISTTAIGAGSDSANVFYSTSVRTNVAYRVAGFVDSTQATAGTWATSPSLIQGMGGTAISKVIPLGALVLLDIKTASASATVDFTSRIDGTYDNYMIKINNLFPASNGVELNVRYSQAASFKTDANYYWAAGEHLQNNTGSDGGGSAQTVMRIATALSNSAGAAGLEADLYFSTPDNTTVPTRIHGITAFNKNAVGATVGNFCGYYNSTGAIDGVQFILSVGNITSGVFRLYGIKDA